MKKEIEKDEEEKKSDAVTESKKEKEDESSDSKEDIKTEDIKKEVDATILNILRRQFIFHKEAQPTLHQRPQITFDISYSEELNKGNVMLFCSRIILFTGL